MKNKINNQNDVLCFRKILINKWVTVKIVKNNNDGVDAAAGYGLLMTVVAATAAVIIFGLTLVGMS